MIEINVKAIEERWETAYQTREGGWVKVRGQPDARADVRALIARVRELESIEAERSAHPLVFAERGREIERHLAHARLDVAGFSTERARELFGRHHEEALMGALERVADAELRIALRTGTDEHARMALELRPDPYPIETTAGPTGGEG